MAKIAATWVLLFLFVWGCQKSQPHTRELAPAQANVIDSLIIELSGKDGLSVFELTRSKHEIDYMESTAGVFVKAIDSVESGYQYGWIYSINDSIGQIASDRFLTKDGDRVKWHFRKF